MTSKHPSEMTLQEIQEFARKADSDAAAAREAARLEAMGIKPRKTVWTQADIDATAARVAAEEARREQAKQFTRHASELSDSEYEAELRRHGVDAPRL